MKKLLVAVCIVAIAAPVSGESVFMPQYKAARNKMFVNGAIALAGFGVSAYGGLRIAEWSASDSMDFPTAPLLVTLSASLLTIPFVVRAALPISDIHRLNAAMAHEDAFSEAEKDAILDERVFIGMSLTAMLCALGQPADVTTVPRRDHGLVNRYAYGSEYNGVFVFVNQDNQVVGRVFRVP